MATIAFVLRLKAQDTPARARPFLSRVLELDLPGTAVFLPAIICLLLALQWGGTEYAWNSATVIGLFCGFAGLIAVFIGVQFWQGDNATLPPWFFKNRDLVLSMIFSFVFGAAFFPLVYYLCRFPPLSSSRPIRYPRPLANVPSPLLPGGQGRLGRRRRRQADPAPPRRRRLLHDLRRADHVHRLLQLRHPPVHGPRRRRRGHAHDARRRQPDAGVVRVPGVNRYAPLAPLLTSNGSHCERFRD